MKIKYSGMIVVLAAMCALNACDKKAPVAVTDAKPVPPAMVDETPKPQTPAQKAALGQYKVPPPVQHKYVNPKF